MLLRELPRHGVELELGLPSSRAVGTVPLGWRVTLLSPGRGLRWWIAPLAFVPYTVRLLRQRRPDLLRGHSVLFTGPSLLLGRALVGARVPIVLHHLHSESRWAWLENAVLRRADAVVTISEHSAAQLVAAGIDPARIHVVLPGIETPSDERSEPWPDAWPAPHALRLLYLSRLVDRKRPQIAVETLAEVIAAGLDASLAVAGDGPLRPELMALAGRLGVGDRVTFLGGVRETEKWRLYDSADVLLFPSRLEGFGFVVAEAQARGLPVVVAAGTATSEIVVDGETGFATEPTPSAFADAVLRLRDHEARMRVGIGARQAAKRFRWSASAAAVADAYRATLRAYGTFPN
jgi:glycosyltransferase involved in cell wall biosynthesis